MTKSRTYDALIIGGGSAGLRAAIEAHDAAPQYSMTTKAYKQVANG